MTAWRCPHCRTRVSALGLGFTIVRHDALNRDLDLIKCKVCGEKTTRLIARIHPDPEEGVPYAD